MNLSDSRLSIGDEELYARQNMMPVGDGQQCIPIYGGDRGAVLHAGTVRETFGGQITFPGDTSPRDVFLAIFTDGSAWQRQPLTATDTEVAPAGFFAPDGHTGITPWRDGPVLFLDPQAGYCKWDGVTFTVIDAAKKGSIVAVFEGHAWLVTAARTIEYTAPNTFDDFDPTHGAGALKITDEAFEGAIFQLLSTVEQLWILGATAIDALGNVQTTGGVTTFAITNAVRSLGSIYPNSVVPYYRLLTMATGYSFHALLGVTPQKLSSKIDRLFAHLSPVIPTGPRAGVVTLNGQTILAFLYTYNDPVGAAHPIVVCFMEGQWFTCSTPDLGNVLDMATLSPNGVPELYVIDDSGRMYRLFARPTDPMQGVGFLATKLYEFARPIDSSESVRVGVDLSGPLDVGDTVSVDLTLSSLGRTKTLTKVVAMLPQTDSPLGLRYGLLRADAPMAGFRIGVSLRMACADRLCVEAIHLESDKQGEWDAQNP